MIDDNGGGFSDTGGEDSGGETIGGAGSTGGGNTSGTGGQTQTQPQAAPPTPRPRTWSEAADQLRRQIADLRTVLDDLRGRMESWRRERALERELESAGAIDVAAAASAAAALLGEGLEGDLRAAVRRVRAASPGLFRREPARRPVAGPALSVGAGGGGEDEEGRRARAAAAAGDHGALMRYMRLRRAGV
jgi:hypothetical protein